MGTLSWPGPGARLVGDAVTCHSDEPSICAAPLSAYTHWPALSGGGAGHPSLLTKAKPNELRSQPADQAPAEAVGMGSPDLCVRSSRRSTGPDLTQSHQPRRQMPSGRDTLVSQLAGTVVTHFSASPSVRAVSLSVPARAAYCTSPQGSAGHLDCVPGAATNIRHARPTRPGDCGWATFTAFRCSVTVGGTYRPTRLDIHPPPSRSSDLRATGLGLGSTHGSPGSY